MVPEQQAERVEQALPGMPDAGLAQGGRSPEGFGVYEAVAGGRGLGTLVGGAGCIGAGTRECRAQAQILQPEPQATCQLGERRMLAAKFLPAGGGTGGVQLELDPGGVLPDGRVM